MPKKSIILTLLSFTHILFGYSETKKPNGDVSILPSTSQLEVLWQKGEFTEGVTVATNGQVYFSDIPSDKSTSGRILKFNPKTRETVVYSSSSEKSNGLMFDRDGRLIACCGANNGRMALCEIMPNGKIRTLTATFQGRRYLSPNDLTILPNGTIYFSDPRYIGDEKMEQKSMSVYRYNPFNGSVELAIDSNLIEKPNGLALSPDGKTLYVAETNNGSTGGQNDTKDPEIGRMTLNSFPLMRDGNLGDKKTLVNFGSQTGIDGMTVDTMGNIYAAVRSKNRFGIIVYTPKGKELAYIPTEALPTNCCFGTGEYSNILYITAGGSLCQIKMNVSGFHPATASIGNPNKTGWVSLFNGKTTEGWNPRGEIESLKALNGELHLLSKKNVWVVSDTQATDFEVELEVKLPLRTENKNDNFNSGLGFRLLGEKGKPKGYQCEIERSSAGKNGGIYGIGFGGWLYPKGPEESTQIKKDTNDLFIDSNWNKVHVRVIRDRVETWINGQKISDIRGIKKHNGRFGIQHHGSGGTVKFRSLRFRPISI